MMISEQQAIKRDVILVSLSRWVTYAFVLLIPFSVFWPIGKPYVHGVLPLYVTPGLYLSDIAIIGMLIGLINRKVWRWQQRFEMSSALLGLALLALLTTPWALIPKLAGYTAFRWLIAFAVYLWFVQSDVPLERLVRLFVAGLCIHATVGVAQLFVGKPLGLPGELTPIIDKRAFGLTFNPNVLGGYMAIGLLLLMPLVHRWSIRCAWWLLWLGLLLSFSRSAWLATALTVPVIIIWLIQHGTKRFLISFDERSQPVFVKEGPRAFAILFIGAGIILLATYFVRSSQFAIRLQTLTQPFVQETLASAPQTTEAGFKNYLLSSLEGVGHARMELIKIALEVMAVRPLYGIGANNFPVVMLNNTTTLRPMFVHNVPLMLAAEVGVLGGAIWLTIWTFVVLLLIRYWRTANSWAIVTLCAWLAFAIIGLFDCYPWQLNSGRLLTVMLSGLLVRTLKQMPQIEQQSEREVLHEQIPTFGT